MEKNGLSASKIGLFSFIIAVMGIIIGFVEPNIGWTISGFAFSVTVMCILSLVINGIFGKGPFVIIAEIGIFIFILGIFIEPFRALSLMGICIFVLAILVKVFKAIFVH